LFAWRLAVSEGNGVGFRRATQATEKIRSVTHEEVQALAREIFAPESVLRMVQQ
jgi:predicted Zn-dependent peptidase